MKILSNHESNFSTNAHNTGYDQLKISAVNNIQNISIISVEGELSRRNMRLLDGFFSSCSKYHQRNIILDFGQLEHIDYQLVRRLADYIVSFQCEGGDIKMAGVSPYVTDILQVMGLEEDFYPSVEDALLSFAQTCPHGDLQ